ncbi:glycosyltransferase, partial [Frankia sp. AgKG'84/4]|nr:glycosyltransferase [Frankia sp. AgKG'84/4]
SAGGAARSAGGAAADAAGVPDRAGVAGTGDRAAPVLAMLPLLVVIFPESMYALQQSWTEPVLVACLAAMVLAVRGGHPRAAVVAFALALAAKQHIVLLLPVAALWPAFGVRRAGLAAGLAALFVAPWVLAGPRDFIDDAVWTNLHYRVLGHSLSVPGWASHFAVTVGFLPALVALAAAYAGIWWARGNAVGFCLGGALVTVVLDLMNKQTFFNHYTLPMGLLVLAAVLLCGPVSDGPVSDGPVSDGPVSEPAGPPDEAQRNVEKRSSAAPS